MQSLKLGRLALVVPVFNDWASFSVLLSKLDDVSEHLSSSLAVFAIDDGSTEEWEQVPAVVSTLRHIQHVEIVQLAANVGHQRAIAVGLCVVCDDDAADKVLVMDSDGEDPPSAIDALLQQAGSHKDFCVVAARRRRSENLTFKFGYVVYKSLFKLVTGKQISFGNFSLLSISYARRLTMTPDLWNNLPAAILRSRLPVQKLFVDRGTRYAGKSKMNFNSLVTHGFSAISVYADTIFVRLLIASVFLVVLSAILIGTTITIRLLVPSHATPGWATTVSFGMIIILLQVLFTTLTSLLMLLNNRVQRLILPCRDYHPYLAQRHPLLGSNGAIGLGLLGKTSVDAIR